MEVSGSRWERWPSVGIGDGDVGGVLGDAGEGHVAMATLEVGFVDDVCDGVVGECVGDVGDGVDGGGADDIGMASQDIG